MDLSILMDPGHVAAIQNLAPPVTALFGRFDFLDSMQWYFIVISVLTLGLHPRYGVRLATLFGLNSGLNEAVKLACHLPRPYWVSDAVTAYSSGSSFGFPSGAAMYGAAMYGYIAVVIRKWWVVLVCIIMLLTAGISRFLLGIHFVLDVLGGWILGFLLLAVFLLAMPRAEAFAARISRPARIALFVGVAAVPLLLVILPYLSLAGWQLPAAWAALALQQTGHAIDPVQVQYAYGASGIILGSLCGYECLRAYGGWNPPGDLKRRVMVLVLGTLSVLVVDNNIPALWDIIGLSAAVPHLATFLSMTVVTFWLMACVPLLAKKAGFS
jgi:membrane-associated phospholipid phosphatase